EGRPCSGFWRKGLTDQHIQGGGDLPPLTTEGGNGGAIRQRLARQQLISQGSDLEDPLLFHIRDYGAGEIARRSTVQKADLSVLRLQDVEGGDDGILPLGSQAAGVAEDRRQKPLHLPQREGAGLQQPMGQQVALQRAEHPIQNTLIDKVLLHREKGGVIPLNQLPGFLVPFPLPDGQNNARRLGLPTRSPVSALHRRVIQNPLDKRKNIQNPVCI